MRYPTVRFFWFSLLVATGACLYLVKYQVASVRAEIQRLNADVAGERETLRVLEAEWAYLTQPERLQRLSSRYLNAPSVHSDYRLEHATSAHFVSLDMLPLPESTLTAEAPAAPSAGMPAATSPAMVPVAYR